MNSVALILAGGEGKRFKPITASKTLFPFFSKPIIVHTVDSLTKVGFKNQIIVVNKQDEKEIKKLTNTTTQIVIQKSHKGMADAVLSVKDHLKNKSVFIVSATDIVDQNLFKLVFKNINKKQAFIVAKKQNEYFDGGYLKFSGKMLTGIIEKPTEDKQPSNLINLVFHYFPNAFNFLKLLKKTNSKKDDLYEQALSVYIKENKVKVITYTGYWQALKFPWHILDITKIFLKKRLHPQNNSSQISNSAHIDKNVFLGKGVKVLENAVIKGPSYIGENTIIGTNALIIESMIGKNCVIGFSSEVSRSYIGNDCWLHTNYIGDSVLEGDNYFGAGAVTANFRFDAGNIHSLIHEKLINTKKTKFGSILGKSARVGVNASLMPGVKIGSNAFIGPGIVQYRDLKPGKRIFYKQ